MQNCKILTINDLNKWESYLTGFSDANIYQTWNYAKIMQDEKQVQHLAFLKNDEVIGIAQVRIKTIPYFSRGVAYIYSGPLWRKKDNKNSVENFSDIISALKKKFVLENKLVLRIKPYIFSDEQLDFPIEHNPLLNMDFRKLDKVYTSLLLNLNDDLETINKNLKPRWRNYLNQSIKNELKIAEGNDGELFRTFIKIYEQMMDRKSFREYVSPVKLMKLNETLDNRFKCKVFVAYKDDQPAAGLVGTAISNTGIYLIGATNEHGLELRASYLLHWEMIKWMKSMGCLRYDLGGANKERNPGGYKFKSGISKFEITDLGIFETSGSNISKLVLTVGEKIHN